MKILNIFKKALNFCVLVIMSILLLINLYILVAKIFLNIPYPTILGYTNAILISGSMIPELEVHDMIIIHKTDNYDIDDIITFQQGERLVTHRIVDKTNDNYITKGDYNNIVDQQNVSNDKVIGKVAFVIPKCGLYIRYLQTPAGLCSMFLVSFLLVAIFILNPKEIIANLKTFKEEQKN